MSHRWDGTNTGHWSYLHVAVIFCLLIQNSALIFTSADMHKHSNPVCVGVCVLQWAVVGDTFPVGCKFQDSIVYRNNSFQDNPDDRNPSYKSVSFHTSNKAFYHKVSIIIWLSANNILSPHFCPFKITLFYCFFKHWIWDIRTQLWVGESLHVLGPWRYH